ncbi:hypothetical protein GOBAR_AA27217 [Gossypium barbadense]|uniref:Ubiquinone biosynthesis protein n=1 Tax=Gossypium barbadense TaxID=3634 RepID=A0A2P5WQY3_GOSBA|nr:hypothetical protein GOBAR_AA27217 [Gossypium barbadense]
MYRTAANRLLHQSLWFSTTADPQTFPNKILHPSDSSMSSSSTDRDDPRNPKTDSEEEQARVLQASLRHVMKFGWSEEAMTAGAKEIGVSPSIVGYFPRKAAALVQVIYFDFDYYLLIDRIDSKEQSHHFIPSQRIAKLVRIRLEMLAPYIPKWPQAHPLNVPASFKQRAMLVDEIWHTTTDEDSDIDWYVKCTVLGGIYSTTEVYMLTDHSPEFCDTQLFLDDQVKDASYLVETVGTGMGSSLQVFVGKVLQR